jgi:hypothetical protein
MNLRFLLAVFIAWQMVLGSAPLFAQTTNLAPREKRTYHACLYSHWIDNYCRFFAWGASNWTFQDCVIANGGCDCVFANGEYWGPDIVSACSEQVPRHHF